MDTILAFFNHDLAAFTGVVTTLSAGISLRFVAGLAGRRLERGLGRRLGQG